MNLLPFQVYNDPTNINDMRELARQVLGATWVRRKWKWEYAKRQFLTCSDSELYELAAMLSVLYVAPGPTELDPLEVPKVVQLWIDRNKLTYKLLSR